MKVKIISSSCHEELDKKINNFLKTVKKPLNINLTFCKTGSCSMGSEDYFFYVSIITYE